MAVTPIPGSNPVRLATTPLYGALGDERAQKEANGDLKRMEAALRKQQDEADLYTKYFEGDHPLKFATDKFKQVFGNLFGAFADNWCPIIVLAAVERLEVTGFRFGQDEQADKDAWEIWQANNLDHGSVLAHTEAGKCARSYLIVDRNDGEPKITVEHPTQVYVEHEPGDRRTRRMALKKWKDSDGHVRANVYTPTEVIKYRSNAPQASSTWDLSGQDEGVGETGYSVIERGRHGFEVVPVIPLYNNPGMRTLGESDLKVAIPLQNAINKQILDMMIASEYVAYPQRVLTGAELPKDPDTGKPLASAELKAAVSRLWNFESKDARIEQLAAGDLNNYVKPVEMLLQHMAAQTRTPPHYLLSSIINASGDALKAAEAGLVSRVEKKILDFSDAWEEAMRLAFYAIGDKKKASAVGLESMWADPEKKSEAEKVDAAQKLLALEVPHEIAWERAGLSPKEIEKAKKYRAEAAQKPQEPRTPPGDNASGTNLDIAAPGF